MFQRFLGSKHPVSWYKCPYCSAVFDIAAAKPPCPRCGTRCNWTNEIAPLDPRKPANEQVPELGLSSLASRYPVTRRSFLKYAVSAAALVPVAKHFLPPENGWPSVAYAFRHDDWQSISGTFSNRLTGDSVLSESSLERMLIEIRKAIDSKIVINPIHRIISMSGM